MRRPFSFRGLPSMKKTVAKTRHRLNEEMSFGELKQSMQKIRSELSPSRLSSIAACTDAATTVGTRRHRARIKTLNRNANAFPTRSHPPPLALPHPADSTPRTHPAARETHVHAFYTKHRKHAARSTRSSKHIPTRDSSAHYPDVSHISTSVTSPSWPQPL